MALQLSGAISLDDLHVELGATSGTQVSLNDSDVRGLIDSTQGTEVSLDDFYGADSSVTINLTISSSTNNYSIWANKGASYSAGKTTVNLTINSGVDVGSSSTGSYALDTGTGWSTGDTINIINNGDVLGRGGNGGRGGNISPKSTSTSQNGVSGSTGGYAFRAQFACNITNNGTFAGGGGGGGGSGGTWSDETGAKIVLDFAYGGGGGGGGAGRNAGNGGNGGTAVVGSLPNPNPVVQNGRAGGSGTASAGGAGGQQGTSLSGGVYGGAGGGRGANGAAGQNANLVADYNSNGATGGTRGYYATGNSNITWVTAGTRQGRVS